MAKTRFTKSKDGKLRATVRVEFRLTEQEIELLKAYAEMRRAGIEDWKDSLFFNGSNWTDHLPRPAEHYPGELSERYIKAFNAWSGASDE